MTSRLSKAVLALVAAGATGTAIATQFVGESEGRSLTAYRDGAGVWTICDGHTAGVRAGQTATSGECAAFLASDLGAAFAALDAMARVPMPEATRAALASWIYNVGPGAARKSTLIRKLNAGDRMGACAELSRWVIVGGRDCRDPANNCRGVVTRRHQEAELCRR